MFFSNRDSFQIEGTFPLTSPPVLLGYGQQSTLSASPGGAAVDNPVPQASVFIVLDPPLTPPSPLPLSKLESVESDDTVTAASAWTAGLAKQFPERVVQPMIINTEAKSCLVTRFVRPLNIPPGLVAETSSTWDKMVSS